MRAALGACALLAALVTAIGAQSPVVNARVERRQATATLANDVQAVLARGDAAWIGYEVPLLLRQDGSLRDAAWPSGQCRLEPASRLVVLARVNAGALVALRSIPVDCDVDAGGMPLVWLEGVSPEQSVTWLASLVDDAPRSPRRWLTDAAIGAIARHAAAAAVPPLARLARSGTNTPLRTRAISALGQRPAADALPTLDAIIDGNVEPGQDASIRRQAISALGRLSGGAGLDRLMTLARTHRDPDVRKQAMQALGQSRDPRAVDFLVKILK